MKKAALHNLGCKVNAYETEAMQQMLEDAAPGEIRKPWPVPIVFRNGYSKESPEIICKCTLHFGKGKPEWGAEPGKLYYVLKIQEVERRCAV